MGFLRDSRVSTNVTRGNFSHDTDFLKKKKMCGVKANDRRGFMRIFRSKYCHSDCLSGKINLKSVLMRDLNHELC
jgi:hypothetical protein